MFILKSKPSILILSFILALGLSLSLQSILAAWVPPTDYPPLENVPAPITATGINQIIDEDLSVGGDFLVGTDAFYVDGANNKVGIGTTEPGQKLTVNNLGGVEYMASFLGNSTSENIIWVGSDLSPNNAFGINWDYTESGSTANHACLGLFGDDLGAAGGCAGLAIADEGNVGIGTESPARQLHLYKSSGESILAIDAPTNKAVEFRQGTDGIKGYVGWESTTNQIRLINGNNLQNSTTGIFINTDGNVGIGATNPAVDLQVYNSTGDTTLAVTSGTSGNSIIQLGDTTDLNDSRIIYSRSNQAFQLSTAGAERLRIDKVGNVGIGTTNPIGKLEVSGGGILQRQALANIGDVSDGIEFAIVATGGASAGIQAIRESAVGNDAGGLKFFSWNGSETIETMRIKSNGNVGMGTTGPNKLLHLYKDSGDNAELDIQSVAGANNHWAIYQDRTTKDLNFWNNTPTGEKNILTIADDGYIKVGDGGIKFSDGTTQTTAATGSSIPSGAVMSFNLSACPSGWSELVAARGRYIVGLPSGGTLAATVGTALSNQENRAVGKHNHNTKGQEGIRTSDAATVNRWFMYSLQNETTTDAGSVAGTNAPYIQLLICQKD